MNRVGGTLLLPGEKTGRAGNRTLRNEEPPRNTRRMSQSPTTRLLAGGSTESAPRITSTASATMGTFGSRSRGLPNSRGPSNSPSTKWRAHGAMTVTCSSSTALTSSRMEQRSTSTTRGLWRQGSPTVVRKESRWLSQTGCPTMLTSQLSDTNTTFRGTWRKMLHHRSLTRPDIFTTTSTPHRSPPGTVNQVRATRQAFAGTCLHVARVFVLPGEPLASASDDCRRAP